MPDASKSESTIRRGQPRDRDAILALAKRLTIGMAPWRDADACRAAVRGWVEASFERPAEAGAMFVAVDERDRLEGFVSVEPSTHFSGEREAYIGELVVDERCEGRGVGRVLVAAAEEWTLSRGYRTLTLDTGAANLGARRFYARLGFQEEGVQLTKLLERA